MLVTRPASQASALVNLVRAAGGEPVLFPTLVIDPVEPARPQIERLSESDTVIFVSANAAAYGYPLLRDLAGSTRRILAVGRATRQALREMGCREVYSPDGDGGSSEELLASPLLDNASGRVICIVRGQGGRETLKRTLASRGARVSYLECYRRLPADSDPAILARALDAPHGALVVSVTSVAGLANLLELAPDEYESTLLARPLVVIGNRQKAAALKLGWTGPVLTAGAGDAAIVAAIAAWYEQT